MIPLFVLLPRNLHNTTLKHIKNIKSLRPFHQFKPKRRLPSGYKIHLSVSNDIIVSELLVPGERSWDVTRVSSLCSSCNAKAILAMHVPKYLVPDHLAWMNSVDGSYTVKTFPGERSWDVTRVSSLCSSCDAKAILAMLVPKYLVTDHLA